MADTEPISVGQFWLHKDGRRLEVTGIVAPGDAYADGLVILRVWGPAPKGHRMTKMRPDTLPRVAERWHPDEVVPAVGALGNLDKPASGIVGSSRA